MAVYINGKRVDAEPGPKKPTKTVNNIPAGSTFEYDGPVEVTGSIGKGATVKITEGSLTVLGNVEDDARIKVECADSSSITGVNISGVFSGSISTSVSSSSSDYGIFVKGTTGNDVVLSSGHNIEIETAGHGLQVKAEHSFKANDIGDHAKIKAGHSFSAAKVGQSTELKSGHSLNISTLGQASTVKAGHSLNAGSVGKDCNIKAGHSLNISEAHISATLKSGHSKNVGRTVGEGHKNRSISRRPKKRSPFDF